MIILYVCVSVCLAATYLVFKSKLLCWKVHYVMYCVDFAEDTSFTCLAIISFADADVMLLDFPQYNVLFIRKVMAVAVYVHVYAYAIYGLYIGNG